jgi:hypothetical protein
MGPLPALQRRLGGEGQPSSQRIARKLAERSLDLEIHRGCFSAVLFDLILDLLPFIERPQSGALNSGDRPGARCNENQRMSDPE